ncbi:hypothetical protein ILUMI_10242 [Ignelater luminosus]|uniref:Peptidase S1 domain-containing protein n=1 Tax=Ignelater luminosus TaxID=2038154 RepID=A0A8K0GDT6_IGNLU|nr:hypothetical protein ILUMI_10242 [Ignelater luminosus]
MKFLITSFLTICLLTLCHIRKSPAKKSNHSRVVDGHSGLIQDFPYMVGIMLHPSHKTVWCCGSIIAKHWVLTAGHCIVVNNSETGKLQPLTYYVLKTVTARGNTTFISGKAQDFVDHLVIKFLYHDRLTIVEGEVIENDIGLLRVKQSFDSLYEKVINLEEQSHGLVQEGVQAGWGWIFPNIPVGADELRYHHVYILSREKCILAAMGLRFDVRNKLCVSSFESTACKGDSGSPLVVKNLQVGIMSAIFEGCPPGRLNVYVEVAPYVDWIKGSMRERSHRSKE